MIDYQTIAMTFKSWIRSCVCFMGFSPKLNIP